MLARGKGANALKRGAFFVRIKETAVFPLLGKGALRWKKQKPEGKRMQERILSSLLERETVSGQQLSQELGVTRAAVWKQIEKLRALGFDIETLGGQGYRLVACPDSLIAPMIQKGLHTVWAGRNVVYVKSVDSTNRFARELAAQGAAHGTLVIADEQTAGRGRRGRGWMSPAGEGIFMSLILRPQVHPSQVARLSLQTALAVARAIEDVCGLDARIKWPNDIVCSGRKIVGMLLEMNADEQCVHDVVAGVGINVHQRGFDADIAGTASSLDLLSGRFVKRAEVVRAFLQAFEQTQALCGQPGALMEAYRARSATLGRRVRVMSAGEAFTGMAQEITDMGTLIVLDEQGVRREVFAADVSVRGLMGYV